MQGKQNKEFIHCFLLAGRCLASSLQSKASAYAMISWKNKCYGHEDPHFLHLFPNLLLLTIMPFGTVNSIGQFGLAVQFSCPPSFLWTLHFTCCRGWVGTKPPQKERKPWCCASTAHKLTRHGCVISTVLITNPYEENWLHQSQSHHTSPQVNQETWLSSDGGMSSRCESREKKKRRQWDANFLNS